MSLAEWLPSTMASAPRTDDARLTGVRLPYDIEHARRIYERGEPRSYDGRDPWFWGDIARVFIYRHAEAVVIAYDRNRLISEARD